MPVYRHIKYTLSILFILLSLHLYAQQSWNLIMRTNILDSTAVSMAVTPCEAFIVLSKDQCGNCNRNIPDLIELLGKLGYTTAILQVVDQDIMSCKKDEMMLKEALPNLRFHYISGKYLDIASGTNDPNVEQVSFDSTPFLIAPGREKKLVLNEPRLIDEYGRLKEFKEDLVKCSRL